MGNLGIPLDTVVFGDLDNIVLEVRSDAFLRRPDEVLVSFVDDLGAKGQGFPIGHSGTVRMNAGVMGGGDELVIFAVSTVSGFGHGVAPCNTRIVSAD